MTNVSNPLQAISLFSGAGGMDVGVSAAGVQIAYANEINKHAAHTYRQNFGDHITESDINEELDNLHGLRGVDLVFGGPPCQAFSVAGKMDLNDPRAKLVGVFMQVVSALKPKIFIMENVKALASLSKFEQVRKQLVEVAIKNGYSVDLSIQNSKDFGVPQARERMFFVGVRGEYSFELADYVQRYKGDEITTFQALRHLGKQGTEINPKTCNAAVTLAARPVLRKSPYAGMIFNGLGRPINPNRPCPTLPASMGGNKTPIIDEEQYYGRGESWVENYHVHLMDGGEPYDWQSAPKFLRRLTLNEAKVLHSFPVDFEFKGPNSSIYSQIGNAVPCLLSKAITCAMLDVVNGRKLSVNQKRESQLALC